MAKHRPHARRSRDLREVSLLQARPQRDAHLESSVPPWFFWAADTGAMAAAFVLNLFVAPRLQHLFAPGGPLRVPSLSWLVFPGDYLNGFSSSQEALSLVLVTMPTTLVAIGLMGGFLPFERLSRTRLFTSAVAGPLFGLSAFTLVVFALRHQQWSRVLLFTHTALVIAALVSYRMALRTYKLRRMAAGRYARATAFVGRPDDIVRVLADVRAVRARSHYRLVGYFTSGEPAAAPADLPRLGSIDRVAATLVHTPIDLLIIVLPDRGAPWLGEVLRACDYMRVAVQVIPVSLIEAASTLEDLRAMPTGGGVPFPGVFFQPRNIDSGALFLKRLFDAVVASALLTLLSPLFLLIAVAIKTTTPRVPVLYRWRVIGYQGRPFTGYKFTTMVADADDRRAELQHLNEMTGPVFKIKNDPRITPLGRFLRKFSLNELPQLWSVVTGDMSLVGPRPAGSWEIGDYKDWHKRKLSFRPGMTCLWQVRGRNKISSFDDWVRMDLEYIDNWSLWLDARILARTAWVVVAGSGS